MGGVELPKYGLFAKELQMDGKWGGGHGGGLGDNEKQGLPFLILGTCKLLFPVPAMR